MTTTILIALHVIANLLWIGAISSAGMLLSKSAHAEQADRAGLTTGALAIYRKLATPAFGTSFLLGVALIAQNPTFYLHQHWFHGKLTAALVVIALHHVLGARIKRAADGKLEGDGGAPILTLVLVALASAAVIFAFVRPF